MIGRTHGVHAEPTTFGLKLLGWVTELRRQRERLQTAFDGVAVGKLSGAVGAYANTDPRVEEYALEELGLRRRGRRDPGDPARPPRRPPCRHRRSPARASSAMRLEIRHLQRTEVREAREPFAKGQKGSSAMPHKQNPIVCERICGLARILRANAVVGFEDVALWHERDISHSSAERVVLPDSTITLDYMLEKTRWLIEGIGRLPRPHAARTSRTRTGWSFSGRVLLQLVESGLSREAAYEIVQRNALAAWDNGTAARATCSRPTPTRWRPSAPTRWTPHSTWTRS